MRNQKSALACLTKVNWPDCQAKGRDREDCAQQVLRCCQGGMGVLSFGQK
jgi:hypothetical protein